MIKILVSRLFLVGIALVFPIIATGGTFNVTFVAGPDAYHGDTGLPLLPSPSQAQSEALTVTRNGSTFQRSAAAGPARDTPATTTIQNSDGSGTFFRIQSDMLGSYLNGGNSVISRIQAIGDWELDTKSSPVRRVYIDFGDPVIPGDATAPFSSAYVPMRIISKCLDSGIKMQNFALNQTVNCPLSITFDYLGLGYAVRMNANNPGTQLVTWKCLATASGKCVSWQMTPNVIQADGQKKVKGQLIRLAINKQNPEVKLGQCYFSFAINVTTP